MLNISQGFKDAPAFPCPGNTDNKCTDKQLSGFDFSSLPFGPFSSYNNFSFKGWTAGSDNSKRFSPRTGGNKISGVCGHTKEQSPSFGCGDKFSLGGVHVKPEFDCDLEFHYEMPGGSTCKHRTSCSKSGTDVKNEQCGGATSVTVVYPPQPTHTKTTCSVDIHTMTFDCSSSSTKPTKPATTKPATTKPSSTKATSTAETTTTSETKGVETTTSTTKGSETSETSSSTLVVETTPAVTSPPVTTSPPFGNGTTSTASETTSESIKETTSESIQESTSTYVTSFLSTSTIFTTSVSTITSCAETVTNCPARSVTTTIVTVAVSTTICPVTETRTSVHTKPTGKVTKTTASSETTSKAIETTSTTSSSKPVETLPCPNVVPQCLNTFMFSVACSDNSDSACYCPDEIFVKNVFNCIYAHGESAQVVSEAVIFLQGICAPYVPSNPAIATGATVTSFVTASATVTTSLAPVYTTVTVEATTVVPCTDSAGSVIASSSSTIVVSTAITVPNVAFTTGTGSASSIGLVPVTATTASPTITGSSKATTTPATLITAPAGTGFFTPKPSATGIVTVSSSHRVSAGFGLALAVMALVAAL